MSEKLPADPTPTEWLLMEVLAARARLGETSWPFPNVLKPTIRRLARRDWVDFEPSTVEGFSQVWLMPAGRIVWGVPNELLVTQAPLPEPFAGLPTTPSEPPPLVDADGSGALFDHPPHPEVPTLEEVLEKHHGPRKRWWRR